MTDILDAYREGAEAMRQEVLELILTWGDDPEMQGCMCPGHLEDAIRGIEW